jgi:putative hydrolase of the HAD superfamily
MFRDLLACKSIRVIAFDAVGTLIHPARSVAATYTEIAATFGVVRQQESIAQRFRAAFAQFHAAREFDSPSLATNEERERETWRSIVCQVFEVEGPTETALFERLWRHYSLASSWRLYDDARVTLQLMLSEGVEWAIASNFDSRLHAICQGDPLLSRSRAVFPSSQVLWRKPSGEFFLRIAATLDLQPTEILLVGDDAIADYEGARNAGWRALWLNRTSSSEGELTTLANLADHIRRL